MDVQHHQERAQPIPAQAAGTWVHRYTCEVCDTTWCRTPGHRFALEDECPHCYDETIPHEVEFEYQS